MMLAQRSVMLKTVMIIMLMLMLMLMLKSALMKMLGCPIRWSN